MINKHENISVGVYWVRSWLKVVWVIEHKGSITSKNWEKYSQSTLGETGGQMWAVVCYSVRLRKSDRERARDLRRDAQTRERRQSAVLVIIVIKWRETTWAKHVARMP
jgi:hypothetical protein